MKQLTFRKLKDLKLEADSDGGYLCDLCYENGRETYAVVALAPIDSSIDEILEFHWKDEVRVDGHWRYHFFCGQHAEVCDPNIPR